MDTFIELQLKTGGIIAISVLLFVLLLAKDHFFNRNRAWLLATLIVPWIVPVVAMPAWLKSLFFKPEVAAQPLVLTMDVPVTYGEVVAMPESINWTQIGLSIYAVVSLLLVVRLIWGYVYIHRLKKRGQHQHYKGFGVVLLKDKGVNPFSFFRTIYLPKHLERDPNRQMILEHERNHCAQLHSIDISLAEWLLIIQWWNPFVWWLRKLIAQNHEYCVDNAMVHTTCEPKEYQYSLLNLLQGHKQMQLVNNFNQSLTKKRLVMMNKKHTNKIIGWAKGLLVLPLVIAALLAFTNPDKTVVKPVDKLEINDAQSLRKYFAMRIKYPVQAQEEGVEGTVTVHFKVDKKGKVSDVTIGSNASATQLDKVVVVAYAKDTDKTQAKYTHENDGTKHLEEEAKRVVETMPEVKDKALRGKLLQIDFEFMLQKRSIEEKEQVSSQWEEIKTQVVNSKGEEFTLIASNGHIHLNGPETNQPEFVLDKQPSTKEEVAALDISDVGAIGKSPAGLHVKALGKKAENGAFTIHTKSYMETLKRSSVFNVKKSEPSLYFVDGNEVTKEEMNELAVEIIDNVNVLKGDAATKKYGEKAKDGAIEITTKSALKEEVLLKSTDKVKVESFSIDADSGEAPVFIVDGERRSVENMNAEDIEVVTVLKDPEVTQLYGEGAENGVVLVTTKDKAEEKVIFKSTEKAKISSIELNITDENGKSPLYIVDGERITDGEMLKAKDVEKVSVLKGEEAIKRYGEDAKNGAILIETKSDKNVDEVVVVGYGAMNKSDMNNLLVRRGEKAENVWLKGASGEKKPHVILDGEEFDGDLKDLDAEKIKSMTVLKDESAKALYGEKAEHGVIIIESKKQ
ncbi:TonB family protein [Carboxylicivirga sp. A043]|uniref:M56 family metallopeptidase n=1 Tax=Carboxylicivirga litoralis TaxID=2816963 RepID=UPI0021CB81AA|nr:TonB family protein [Carboxylicivirga sp. A043]MCU4156210.1 TonB family protein [Carboxylicivirga sp. A043]